MTDDIISFKDDGNGPKLGPSRLQGLGSWTLPTVSPFPDTHLDIAEATEGQNSPLPGSFLCLAGPQWLPGWMGGEPHLQSEQPPGPPPPPPPPLAGWAGPVPGCLAPPEE